MRASVSKKVDWNKRYERLLGFQQMSSVAAAVGRQNAAASQAEHDFPAPDASSMAHVRERPAMTPEQEAKAWKTMAHQYADEWGKLDRRFSDITPMGATAAVNGTIRHSLPSTLINAYNQSINYFAAAAGDPYLSAYILAMGNNDAQQRQATLAALNRIIGGGVIADVTTVRGTDIPALARSGPELTLSPEQFGEVVANPSAFNNLARGQQELFISQAQRVVQAYKARGGQADAVERAMGAIATGNLEISLSEDEVADVQSFVRTMKQMLKDGDGSISDVAQVALAGAQFPDEIQADLDMNIIRIDPEWAKKHPAKAATEAYYLQQQFPDFQIEFGSGPGIGGQLLDTLGKPVDLILALPSAAANILSDGARKAWDNGDVNELKQAREEAVQKLATVTSPTARAELLNTVDHLNDRIGIKTGQGDGFWDLVDHALYETPANLGFAENIVQGTGLLPGDYGYETAIAGTMLVGSVAADPVMWATGVAQGTRAAATVPRVVDAAGNVVMDAAPAVRGLISRFVYNRMAVTPEQFMRGPVGTAAVKNLAKLRAAMPVEDFDVLLQSSFGERGGAFARQLITAAGTDERALREVFTQLMTNYTEGKDLLFVHNRIQKLAQNANDLRRLENAQHTAQLAENERHAARVAALERHIDELEDAGDIASPEYLAAKDELEGLVESGPRRAPVVDPRDLNLVDDIERRLDELEDADLVDTPEWHALKDDLLRVRSARGEVPVTFEEWKAARQAGADTTIMVDLEWLRTRATNPTPRTAENLSQDVASGTTREAAEAGERGYAEVAAEMDFAGWSMDEPLHVVYDYKAETFTIFDGTHRIEIASDLGITRIPVEFTGNADLRNTWKMLQREFPEELYHPATGEATMADATYKLDSLRAARVDEMAELIYLKSLRRGKQGDAMPINFGDLRQLNKTGNEYAKAIFELHRDLPDFPVDPGVVTDRVLRARASNLLKRMRQVTQQAFKPTGFGEGAEAWEKFPRGVALPGIDLGDATADVLEQSRRALIDVGHTLGVPENVIAGQLGQWDNLVLASSREDSYQWFKETWQRFVLESPKLDVSGKAALADIWHTPFEQWGSDTVRTSKAGEVVQTEPLGYRLIPDPDGDGMLMAGQPVFSADTLNHAIFFPDIKEVMKFLHPKLARYVNSDGVTLATNFWKRAVLTSRMPFALPARIVGELLFGRMSAFDLASVSNWGVLDWFRSVRGSGRFGQWMEDEAFALGNMIEGFGDEGRQFNKALNVGVVTSRDGDLYYRALSGRMGFLASSPEMNYIMDAASPEEFVALVNDPNAPAAIQEVARNWDRMEGGRDAVASNVWRYINEDLIGTGDYADSVRALLRGGVGPDGEAVGSVALANRLKLNAQTGKWFPGVHDVHGKYAAGLDVVARPTQSVVTRFNDWMFRAFYGWPEKKLGRLPAYRQLAQRNFERLTAMGYPEKTAHEIARASAMRETSRLFFRIGAHTSGEWAMRNISPFFPAWREVTNTWLMRIPERLGGGSRILGTAYMLRRADLMYNVMTHMGIIQKGPDGKLRIGLPFLNPLVNAIMPGDEEFNVSASFDSLFGILPFPSLDADSWRDQVSGMLPGLGGSIGVPTQALAQAALDRTNPGWQQDLADLIAPYGVGSIGANVSRFYAAMALAVGMDPVPPWDKWTNPEFREQMVLSSIDDAIRIVVGRGGRFAPPEPPMGDKALEDPAVVTAYAKEYAQWKDRVLAEAEKLASASYFNRALLSSILPMSTNFDTQEADQLTAVWALLNDEDLPEAVRKESLTGPLLESFKTAYPYADWYVSSKTESFGRRGQLDAAQEADIEAVFAAGFRSVRSPEEYIAWSYGMQSYSAYLARKSAIYARFDNNPVDYLLNGAEARDEIAELDEDWNHYLTFMDEAQGREGMKNTFKDLFEDAFDRTHRGRSIVQIESETIKQQLPGIMDHVEEGTYDDFRQELMGNMKFLRNNEGGMWESIDKYYRKVADPYYKKLNVLWEEVNRYADEDPRKAAGYAAIRAYTSRQRPVLIDGVKYPTPEQVSFYTKTDEERTQWAVKKLSWGHPEWLTKFEQDILGFGQGKPVAQLTNFATQQNMAFDAAYPTSSTPGYYDADARRDRAIQAKAKSLGISYEQWTAPLYQKANRAGLGSGPGFQQAVQYANQVKRQLAGADLVLDSDSTRAIPAQRWLFTQLNALYQADRGFRDFVDQAAYGLGEEDQPLSRQDVFYRVFLDGYGGAPAYLYA